jgi:hypothetical protein
MTTTTTTKEVVVFGDPNKQHALKLNTNNNEGKWKCKQQVHVKRHMFNV